MPNSQCRQSLKSALFLALIICPLLIGAQSPNPAEDTRATSANEIELPKVVPDIVKNRLKKYQEFRARLEKYGENAPFEEFRPVVVGLRKAIMSERV